MCDDDWEDEEEIWFFFIIMEFKIVEMWVEGRRRRSEFWCDSGFMKEEEQRKKWKIEEADDDDGHLFFEALTCQTILFIFCDFLFFLFANYTHGIKKIKSINKYTGGMPSMVDWVKSGVLQKGVNMGGHFCHFFNRGPKLLLLQI